MATRIFERANQYNTSCYSCSALNFSSELKEIDRNGIKVINSWGPGTYETYSIHQIEPIIALMGTDAKRVMFLGDSKHPSMLIEFSGERRAQIANFTESSFAMNIGYNNGSSQQVGIKSDFFKPFIKGLIQYFETGIIPVPHEQTLAVIAVRTAGLKAMNNPFTWVNV